MHEYYLYDKKRLLESPKLKLSCYKDNEEVFKFFANEMINEIITNESANKHTVFICPVGPIGHYKYFVDFVNEKKISLKNVWFINMDEYLDDNKEYINIKHRLSFRKFMNDNVYTKIDENLLMPKEQRVFPDPKNPSYIKELIARLGGVDMALGGIGINGHVAFNEPEVLANDEFLNLETRVLEVSKETRTANAIGDFNGALEDMPKYCVTIGMKEIFGARKIRLACFRNWHRAVVRRCAYGEATSEFPVSLLREHKDISLSFTEFVADLD